MSDPSTWSTDEMAKCLQSHATADDSVLAVLRPLNLNQKQKLLELMQKWTSNLK